MSTQTRNSGGSRNQKKSNSGSGGGGGGGGDSISQASHKKTDLSKTEKEKSHPKPTAEQLRIALITNSNTLEDPHMREKVATLIELTQRSEEEVCCALYECDNNLDNAVLFLLETLPVGAFETSSKKKKNKAANAAQDNSGGDGDWADGNANTDKREKSRNRNSSNRGGRAGSDSRGWRGREARENERNTRGGGGGGDRDDRTNDNYRGGPRGVGGGEGRRGVGGGRGGGYVGRGGRGGGRMGGGRGAGGRGERSGGGGGYSSRYNNTNDDHQEVELWDNTIAQNAEKQQQQSQDDAWGDWDNEEYVGSLKDSKVFTTSNLPNQTAASVLSSGLAGSGTVSGSTSTTGVTSELSAQQGLDHHHLGTSVLGSNSTQSQGSHLNSLVGSNVVGSGIDDNATSNLSSVSATPIMQYSAAVSSTPQMQQQQQQQQQQSTVGGSSISSGNSISGTLGSSQYGSAVDSFSNAATAAANLVQQVQQQQHLGQQMKSATLSAEQSQYFNSLTSQNAAAQAAAAAAAAVGNVPQQQQMASYAQNPNSVQYPTSYANVFSTGTTGTGSSTAITTDPTSQIQSSQQPQVRRARAKLPPPSKIPSSAVEMPGDSLNNIGYIDVQFGGLDFGTDESFENLSEKFNTSVTLDGQQTQQQPQQTSLAQSPQDVGGPKYDQTKSVTQRPLSLSDKLRAAGYSEFTAKPQPQQAQQIAGVGGTATQGVGAGSNTLDQLTKIDPYQQNSASAAAYQSSYQSNANVSSKGVANAYQPSVSSQGYSNSAYGNVQSSVGNSYQPQAYGSYQQNAMASYQQQQQSATQAAQAASNVTGGSANVGGSSSTQNIPSVGGNNSSNSATANSNSSYLSSAYGSQQNAYQSSQSVYGNTGLSNSTGYTGSTNTSSSQYSNFSTNAKLKDTTSTSSNTSHYESVSSSNAISNSGTAVNSVSSAVNSNNAVANSMISSSLGALTSNSNVNPSSSVANNNTNSSSSNSSVANNVASNVVSQSGGSGVGNVSGNSSSNSTSNVNVNSGSATSAGVSGGNVGSSSAVVAASSGGVSSASNKTGSVTGSSGGAPTGASGGSGGGAGSGMVPNIQMVSQYIQTSVPFYQPPVYSYEEIQMMQQRVPHVQGYYDMNYTPTSLGAGRDNLGSVAYSTMTDGRFTRTDNNSSPVSNVSSTMSQQAGSSGPMLNVPYAYFYGGNVLPGSFQYGSPAIYPQIPAANTASGGQFPKPSYNTGYGSTNYDALSQASQDYSKGTYPSSVNQPTKSQNVTNPPQAGTASDLTSSMYGKAHVALNKVNSYEKQNFHSGTPPPFNMANTQTAGGTSAQPYGMYLPTMPAAAGHHMMHPQIHQMDGRIHNSSRRDSNSTGQRQPTSSQSKSATKQGYSPSYWTGQN